MSAASLEEQLVASIVANEPYKRCGCGRRFTREQWALLHLVGTYADEVETIEMRDCGCGSTLAVVIGPGRAVDDGDQVDARSRAGGGRP